MFWLLLACGEPVSSTPQSTEGAPVVEYAGLDDNASWTYRNSGWLAEDPNALDEDTLIRAKHLGDGRVEFRQGFQWVEGIDLGYLDFEYLDGALALVAWDWNGRSGAGWYPFSEGNIQMGIEVIGDWTCVASEPEEGVDTFYANFEQVVIFECSGGGLSGKWSFAHDLGLVAVQSADIELELVAPW